MRTLTTRWLAAGLGAVLVGTLAGPAVSAAPAGAVPPRPAQTRPVPVTPVPVKAAGVDPASAVAMRDTPPIAWPSAEAVDVPLPATAAAPVRAGALPVQVSRASSAGPVARTPAAVRVELLDRAAGVAGLLLRVRRTDGATATASVALTVHYGPFRYAYGGDWAHRLRVVRVADGKVLPSRNDPKAGTITADVPVSGVDTTLAVAAGPSGATGSYAATALALTSSWQASGHTGAFTWSYPLRVPETPGRLAPQLAIAYSSGAVDGRTASTNNQPSWIGEGFDLSTGYIERSYQGCADDPGGNQGATKTGDQCWFSDNATMSLSGLSGQLVRDDSSGTWRLKNDKGARIEKLTGAANGDNDGEYWKVTTREGIQYFFGLNRVPGWQSGNPETQSALRVPVFGNHSVDPCWKTTYAASWCYQAYRWNLDYVVDPRGNAMVYYYAKERNSYGLNLGKETVEYDRAGVVLRAEFGLRHGAAFPGTPPASVLFDNADRCLTNCTVHGPGSFPDVPFDQQCTANCTAQVSPTFWTTKRLRSITTRIGGTPVERWTLNHIFPQTGDSSSPALWLTGIRHEGLYGGSASLPEVTFHGEAKANRVTSAESDGYPPMYKYRVIAIRNESGGDIAVTYAPTNCVPGALPAPENNTLRCFPVYWQPDGAPARTDWMHKYVVASVTQVDRVGGSPTEATFYEYHGGAAWRYGDNELVKPERRTWSDWRGYQKVTVVRGQPDGVQGKTETLYLRGMNGDRLAPSGGVRPPVSVVDSQGGSVLDEDQFAGLVREKVTYNGNAVTASTITDVWQRGPTATHGTQKAYLVDIGAVHERTALSGGGWRRSRISRAYNADGLVERIDDAGNLDASGDEECSRTWYDRDVAAWRLSQPSRVLNVAVACAATPSFPADLVSDVRTTYDTAGNPTRVEQVVDYSGGQPVYATMTRTTFDSYGRPLDTWDALDRRTSSAYTESAGLTTRMTVTNALGHVTTTELTPAWGEPVTSWDPNNRRTDVRYDALGRVAGVWLPGRSEPAGEGPNLRYAYQIRSNGPSVVTTGTLRANANYLTTHALYDGFLRPRQTQSPAWTAPGVPGGRVITDRIYDSRGLLVKSNASYFAEGAPATALVAAGDNNIPSQTRTVYDGVGRTTVSTLMSNGVERWHSTTTYHGDRTDHDPPAGGTATTVHADVDGRTTALHQYRGPDPTGPADVTRYTYTKTGQLATITDPTGNQWRYGYDIRGRRISTHDPDKGDSTARYDAVGQVVSATDARGTALAYSYDRLGRKTEERDSAGALLARWTYDTLLLGLPTSSTRIDTGNVYTSGVTGYDSANRPTGTTVTIPAVEGGLAGTYQTSTTYRPDGSPASTTLPRAGDLPPETLTYEYDDAGLPKRTSGASTYVNDTWYTRFGELSQVSMGGPGARVWHDVVYDDASRRLVRSTLHAEKTAYQTVNDFRYDYDPAGNITRIADVPGGGSADIQCFQYDYLRRMTEAWTSTGACTPGSAGGSNAYWTSYRYDLTGDRTGETRHGLGGAPDTTRTYSYGSGHRLSSVTTSNPSGSTVDTFGYDGSGNTVTRNLAGSTQTLTWDAAGRLGSGRAADGATTTLGYDADGTRLLRRDPTASTLYLGGQQIRWDRTTNAKTGTRFYAHGGLGVAVRNSTGLYWQAGDHHGTSTTSVKADSPAVTRRLFTPFGETRGAAPASWPDERGFVGGTRDESLGLTQLGAREYDARNGRFISVDPIIDPNDPQQLNAYAYANNNPASMSDPDGLKLFIDVDGMVSIPSIAHATPDTIKRAEEKAAKITKSNVELKRKRDAAVRSTGHTQKEYDEARKLKEKTVFDVVIEAGGEVLKEFLGIDDIKGCFGNGDLGSCISMVINVVPWTKIFRIGELVSAVRKAWKAVSSFRGRQRWADDVIGKVDDSLRSCKLHSFRPDTNVRMADGSTRPIAAVRLGDTVLATDPKTGRVEARRVVALHINVDHTLVDLGLRAGAVLDTVHTTEHHPFWSETDQAWVDAGQLEPGDVLRTPDGRRIEVATVHRYTGAQVMRDLTVEGLHTYYVVAADAPVLVHNCGGDSATVYWNGQHATVEVKAGGNVVHTDQNIVAGDLSTTGRHVDEARGGSRQFKVDLPRGGAAQRYQRATVGTNQDTYDLHTNSCLTYCSRVLWAGGLDTPQTSSDFLRWMLRL